MENEDVSYLWDEFINEKQLERIKPDCMDWYRDNRDGGEMSGELVRTMFLNHLASEVHRLRKILEKSGV
jgi:hypothetical protein